MCLWIMTFPDLPVRVCARSIEIPEYYKIESIGFMIILKYPFNGQLGHPIRIHRALLHFLCNRNPFRFPISSTCRRKNNSVAAISAHDLQQVQCVYNIIVIILLRIINRFPHVCKCCQMHNRFNLVFLKHLFKSHRICQISLDKCPPHYCFTVPVNQIIIYDCFISFPI